MFYTPLVEKKRLLVKLESASSYEEFVKIALELDKLEGNDLWKLEAMNGDRDYDLIKSRYEEFVSARINNDPIETSFLLRTSCFILNSRFE